MPCHPLVARVAVVQSFLPPAHNRTSSAQRHQRLATSSASRRARYIGLVLANRAPANMAATPSDRLCLGNLEPNVQPSLAVAFFGAHFFKRRPKSAGHDRSVRKIVEQPIVRTAGVPRLCV